MRKLTKKIKKMRKNYKPTQGLSMICPCCGETVHRNFHIGNLKAGEKLVYVTYERPIDKGGLN